MSRFFYTSEQISFVVMLKQLGNSWDMIAEQFSAQYDEQKSAESLRHLWKANKNFHVEDTERISLQHLKEVRSTKLKNSRVLKENNKILDTLNAQDTILEAMEVVLSKAKKLKLVAIPKPKHKKERRNMTLELMVSDVHFGKLTKTFNLAVCKTRIQELVRVVQDEIERAGALYNVERLILGLLGDMIESFTMHGLESAASSEVNNSEQITAAIEVLFFEAILPLARTGLVIDVVGVPGNHDRTERDNTLNNPGLTNVTWIIYHALRMLAKQTGLTNVSFDITEGASVIKEIYGKNILFEHGDLVKASTRDALEKHMNQRAVQSNKVLHFFRLGHFHEPTMYGRGKIIVNGSVPGQDSYSELKGYNSEAVQILNFYVDTETRPTPFYRSFPIFLG